MALFKKKKSKQQNKTSFAPRKAQTKPVWSMVFLTLSILYFVAIFDFEPSQSQILLAGGTPEKNMVGALGANLSDKSIYYFGVIAWGFPLFLLWTSFLLLFKRAEQVRIRYFIAFVVCMLTGAGIAQLVDVHLLSDTASVEGVEAAEVAIKPIAPGSEDAQLQQSSVYYNGVGGRVGELVVNPFLITNIGSFGTSLLIIITFMIGAVFLLTDNLHKTLESIQARAQAKRQAKQEIKDNRQKAIKSTTAQKSEPDKEAIPTAAEKKKAEKNKAVPNPPSTRNPIIGNTPNTPSAPKRSLGSGEAIMDDPDSGLDGLIPEEERIPPGNAEPEKKKGTLFSLQKKKKTEQPTTSNTRPPIKKTSPSGLTIIESEQVEKVKIKQPEKKGDYEFPPLELLNEHDNSQKGQDSLDHHETANALVKTLDEFGVKVSPGEVHTGPVITRYEVTPAPGVRVEKILNLDKNIALGLRAEAVRILAPVPGKGTVGIEVPNKKPLPVGLREIIESASWANAEAEIPVVLGKDVTGKAIVEDLTKMPHMLIAGSTGSGKTVCINTIIASLLYHSSPDDLRFIMVDPKVVEMQGYNALPHMLIPVVTDPKKVPGALKYLINEMERRYQIFAKVGVRNIAGFNAKITKDKEEKAKAAEAEAELDATMSAEERVAASSIEVPRDEELEIPDKKLHYIVCIIDELADLMMVAPQDIETGVARIAQLARAAGIHLVLATQRPSVNVITGVIKANLPTRISFKVASKVDSRTILDGGGAEALIGKGDMLFVPPGTSNMVRAQGAFVSDEEINNVVEFLQKNGPPQFAEDVQQQIESNGGGGGAAENTYEDELVPDAIGVLKASKRASTSMLQRRLKIGYNRAARIMEILEDEGIVGPENGSSPREILKDLDML